MDNKSGGFQHAKISRPGNNPDGDFVLGLYYKDDSRRLALAWKYPDNGTVRFRGWKTTLSSLSFGNL